MLNNSQFSFFFSYIYLQFRGFEMNYWSVEIIGQDQSDREDIYYRNNVLKRRRGEVFLFDIWFFFLVLFLMVDI